MPFFDLCDVQQNYSRILWRLRKGLPRPYVTIEIVIDAGKDLCLGTINGVARRTLLRDEPIVLES